MKRILRSCAQLGPLVIAALFATACPFQPPECALCGDGAGVTSSSSSSSSGTITGACAPSSKDWLADAKCGVFVSSSMGNDANAGTPDAPVQTLGAAIAKLGGSTVAIYACAEVMPESITLAAGTSLFGGLDCKAAWAYSSAGRTMIEAPVNGAAATQIAMTLAKGVATTHVEGVSVKAADATMPGGSSIAALVDGVVADIVRSDFAAGNGAAGAVGETPSDPVGPSDPNDALIRGVNGVAACTGDPAMSNPGGMGTANATCGTSVGGNGGAGLVGMGEKGADGQPLPDPNPDSWGLGGIGATAASCKSGGDGLLGTDGASGMGAQSSENGTLSSSGYAGPDGQPGLDGSPGQGGGGGGGAKGKANPMCNGASGGGGGAGGCGGKGGLGGRAGGASLAFVSVNATVMLKDVTLSSGNGGAGGDGGDGQNGGTGGVGGTGGAAAAGTVAACDGGKGGQGGFGGKGGGGRGGPSAGIAHIGSAPGTDGVTYTLGKPGTGGLGADAAGAGADGAMGNTLEFP